MKEHTAKVVAKTKETEVHKDHKEHGVFDSYLRGYLFDCKYCPECGEYLLEPGSTTSYSCSNCGEPLYGYGYYKHKYCPNCGAKFEGGENV